MARDDDGRGGEWAPETPAPGSNDARESGCKCPILPNGFGRGAWGLPYLFVTDAKCPVHRVPEARPDGR
jgi:hypothetical protein